MTLFLIIVAVVLIGVAIYLFTRKKGPKVPQRPERPVGPPSSPPPSPPVTPPM